MTEKSFLNNLANNEYDILEDFLELLKNTKIDYCVIGGLAVNAYVEPVVSLDLDIIVAVEQIDILMNNCKDKFVIENFPHSINLKHPKSDLRIQIQTDVRYFSFTESAITSKVMGYEMKVASLENVLQGKQWAYLDAGRRKSKRQKDLADISRLIEAYPYLIEKLPEEIKSRMI